MTSQRSARITSRSKQREYYSDFSIDFEASLVTGALLKLTNEEAVKEAIRNLILTQKGERFYHPQRGSDVKRSLFNPFDDLTISQISESISTAIRQNEPRVDNVHVKITPFIENNTYVVNIAFTVINIPTILQSLEIIINRVR